jgi:hypothetical protein
MHQRNVVSAGNCIKGLVRKDILIDVRIEREDHTNKRTDEIHIPSDMILTASSFFKLFNVKSALKRSCKGTVPLVLRRAERRAESSLRETASIEQDRDER